MRHCKFLSIALVFASLLATGCASKTTVSENQCRAGDWQTIGYRDGAAGVPSTRLLAHQDACGEFRIVPQRERYMVGWQAGLSTYCTADRGFRSGRKGGVLNSVCTTQAHEPYASAYADGHRLYVAHQEVLQLRRQIDHNIARVAQLKEHMLEVTTAQLAPELTVKERVSLLAELQSLAEERAALKARLPDLEDDLAHAEFELDRVNQLLAIAN